MTTATIHPSLRTEAICPPWCEGHDDKYQAWEQHNTGLVRDHAGAAIEVEGAHLYLNQREALQGSEHVLEPSPRVEVYVDRDTAELTPADARLFAAALIEAANQAEARA